MPVYEYQCVTCNHHFERMQKISDAPIKQCPNCSQETVTKLISAAGFQLKGTGWYATDFKNKTPNAPNTSSTKEESAKTKEPTPSTSTSQSDKK